MRFRTPMLALLVALAPRAASGQSTPTSAPTSQPAAAKPAAAKPAAATPTKAKQRDSAGGEPQAGGRIEAVPKGKSLQMLPASKKGKKQRIADVRTEGARRRVERAKVGIEFVPGVAVPFKNYLDFGSGNNTYSMQNGAGFGFAISLTLNFVELRYAYTSLSTGRVQGRLPDDAVTAVNLVRQADGKAPITADIDVEAPSNLVIHNITFGYRFAFELSKLFKIIIPFGFGIVIAKPPDFGILSYSLYGFGGYVGLRGEFQIAGMFGIGVDTRLSIFVTEPDPNLAAAGYAATESIFENAVAYLPMLNVALSLRYHY
ncbi:MAG: hypothetical protein KC503_14560 [Myxococcales bacterium]|nr:hypothetical protein [Myxococcales bacterium]